MSLLATLRFFHFVAMLMWFGTSMLVHGSLSRGLRNEQPGVAVSYAAALRALHLRYMLPGMILSLVTGLWMIFAIYGMEAGYLHAKLAFGLLAALSTLWSVRAILRIHRVMQAGENRDPGKCARLIRQWKIATMVTATLLLLVLISATFLKY